MSELIIDQQKFRKLKEDPTLKRERTLQRTLREIVKKNMFSDIEYSNLYPKDSKPAWIYGTPKIHKAFLPGFLPSFRPIVTSISNYNYILSQYLGSLLSPHIPSEYSTKDSFTFIEEIKSKSVADNFLNFVWCNEFIYEYPIFWSNWYCNQFSLFKHLLSVSYRNFLGWQPLKHVLLLMVAFLIRLIMQWVPHWRLF